MYDPGRDLAVRYPDWRIRSADLGGTHGALWPARRLLVVPSGATLTEWRCCVAHEIVHLDRGDLRAASSWHERRQERQTRIEAARRLIPLASLVEALRWTNDDHELADVLDVDLDTLHCRSSNFTADEVATIERELWDDWRSA